MSKEEKATLAEPPELTDEQRQYVYEDRRYIGRKESVGYIAWDMAQSFNIDTYSERFVNTILQISFSLQQVEKAINGVWDIINDVLVAAMVERTRTRWGKFRPYLIILAGPAMIGTALYWLMPYFFPNASTNDMGKFIMYLLLAMLREGGNTFRSIARGGLLATVTPHPTDRSRIITKANFWSGFLGEKLPEQIMMVLIDLVGNEIIKPKGSLHGLYRKLFSGMGVATAVVAGVVSLWFVTHTRERVMQSIKQPSIKQSIKSILNNRPVLLLTASDILGSLSIGGGKSDYFIEVLNFASMVFFAGIPGAIVHPFSYMVVPWFRRRYSTRFLYFYCYIINNLSMVPVFLVGSIGGMKNGLYKNKWVMLVVLMLQETIYMTQYGLSKVVNAEMYNEAMDYCEWKNGYRTEAMTSVAKGLATKVGKIFADMLSLQIKKWIGYDQTKFSSGKKQTDKTQYFLFANFAILPVISSVLKVIPIFFYNLDGKKRETMYAELLERRTQMANRATTGSAEDIEALAEEQFRVGQVNSDRDL